MYTPSTLLPVPPAGEQRRVTCRACGHPLRDRVSRMLGVGPECQTEEFAARTFEVEQDELPGL